MKRSLLLLAAAALVTGCAAGGGMSKTGTDPRRDLAETPASLSPNVKPRGEQPSEPQATDAMPRKPRISTSTGPNKSDRHDEDQPPPVLPFATFALLADGAEDAGKAAPAYADIRNVDLAANATDLRVTVTMNGTLPSRVPDDEIIGLGIDLYPNHEQKESDYQLFVDGEPEGWFAYLHTPRGLVRYPGTFAIGGTRLVFVVPLESVGTPTSGRVSAFVDWSGAGLVGAEASADYAPNGDPKPYTRN